MKTLSILYDQETVTRNYENEIFNDGMQQGMQQGMRQGMKAMLNRLIKKGLITKAEAQNELKKV